MKLTVRTSTNHDEPQISHPSRKTIFHIGHLLYKISYPYVIHPAPTCIKESKHPVSPKLVPWTSLTSALVHNMGFHKRADGVCTHCFGFNHQWSYISGAFTRLWERTSFYHLGPIAAQQMAYSKGMMELIWLGPLLH